LISHLRKKLKLISGSGYAKTVWDQELGVRRHEYISPWEEGELGSSINFHGSQNLWHFKTITPCLREIRGPL
jgi:hypothetical protein